MKSVPFILGILLFSLFGANVLPAQATDPDNQKPPWDLPNYNWEVDAHEQNLTRDQVETLKKQGFVVTDKEFKQIFEPYVGGTEVFITSDSIINAYSVLLEDSFLRSELQAARTLRRYLLATWRIVCDAKDHGPKTNPILTAAYERDEMVIGVALELSTGEKVTGPAELVDRIDIETQRVIAAVGQTKPAFLGAPELDSIALDYTRFKPEGFYARSRPLTRYFRAVSWLQAIPFRFHNEVEVAAFSILDNLLHDYNGPAWQENFDMGSIVEKYSTWLGPKDNPDLFSDIQSNAAISSSDPDYLEKIRPIGMMKDALESTEINDQLAFPPKDGKLEPSFRIIAAHLIPDALLFSKLEPLHRAADGLQIATALGSPAARGFYQSDNELLKAIDSNKDFLKFNSLYSHYLQALGILFQPADPSAPDLFKKPAWGFKSLQTALGGWALARSVFSLQAKENVYWLGQYGAEPGFVEPVPDFFSKMSLVCTEADKVLPQNNDEADNLDIARENLHDSIDSLKKFAETIKSDPHATLNSTDDTALSNWFTYLLGGVVMGSAEEIKMLPQLEKLAAELDSTTLAPTNNPNWKTLMDSINPPSQSNWYRLANLCSKLEALSEKQLRGVPLNRDDDAFFTDYGAELAGVMFYAGNSFEVPDDDAPRNCDIYSDPASQQHTLVGTGRPRQIYVLYPFGGKQILTRGAVLSYYQFSNPTRLTNAEWTAMLSTHPVPQQPGWVSVLSGTK